MDIEFREMKLREIEDVAEMTVSAFGNYYPRYSASAKNREIKALAEEITKLTEFEVSKYFVIRISDVLIGSVALTIYNNLCYLNSMVIDSSHQKQGYGSKLLEYTCDYVANNSLGNIFLYANQTGEKLYHNKGFNDSFTVTPFKLNFVQPPEDSYDPIEFNFKLPKWIKELELEKYGKSRLKLYDYLFLQETDILTISDKAYCSLRGQTIGNLYAESADYALALLHEAWKLGGEYLNLFDTDKKDEIMNGFSSRPLSDLTCKRMILGNDIEDFANYYGILSFGFG